MHKKKLKHLLSKGYFPAEIPNLFTTKEFSNEILSIEPNSSNIETKCEKYNYSLFSHKRRYLKIPNPLTQYKLCENIILNIDEITQHTKKSTISNQSNNWFTNKSTRPVNIDFQGLEDERMSLCSKGNFILKSDISQFYPSIYTHAIPWAIHGKEESKKKKNDKNLLGNQLDIAIRNTNENHTIGIPIAPDTSRIVAEIVSCAIDFELQNKVEKLTGIRNVDDYFIVFDSYSDAEQALSHLNLILNDYELRINSSKTSIISTKEFFEPIWKQEIAAAAQKMLQSENTQRNYLKKYINLAFYYSNQYPSDNVLKYALSCSISKKKNTVSLVNKSNWDLYESFLLRLLLSQPDTAEIVGHILSTALKENYLGNLSNIKFTCLQLINNSAIHNYTSEIAWALSILKLLDIKINANDLNIAKLESSICAIIALDMQDSGQVEGNLDTSAWQYWTKEKDCLINSMWLLSYEARNRDWMGLNKKGISNLRAGEYFNNLINKHVSFYENSKNIEPLSVELLVGRYS